MTHALLCYTYPTLFNPWPQRILSGFGGKKHVTKTSRKSTLSYSTTDGTGARTGFDRWHHRLPSHNEGQPGNGYRNEGHKRCQSLGHGYCLYCNGQCSGSCNSRCTTRLADSLPTVWRLPGA